MEQKKTFQGNYWALLIIAHSCIKLINYTLTYAKKTYYLGVLQSRKVSDTSKFTSEYSVSGSFIFI